MWVQLYGEQVWVYSIGRNATLTIRFVLSIPITKRVYVLLNIGIVFITILILFNYKQTK